jgi:hypothetical protein
MTRSALLGCVLLLISIDSAAAQQRRCIYPGTEREQCFDQPSAGPEQPNIPVVSEFVVSNSLYCDVAHAVLAGEGPSRKLNGQKVQLNGSFKRVYSTKAKGGAKLSGVVVGIVTLGPSVNVSRDQSITSNLEINTNWTVAQMLAKCSSADRTRISNYPGKIPPWLSGVTFGVRNSEQGNPPTLSGQVKQTHQVSVTTAQGAGLSVNFLIVGFEFGGSREQQSIHMVTVDTTFTPPPVPEKKWWHDECPGYCSISTGLTVVRPKDPYQYPSPLDLEKQAVINLCRAPGYKFAVVTPLGQRGSTITVLCTNEETAPPAPLLVRFIQSIFRN